jgi:DNA-binding response OmpR family regulator
MPEKILVVEDETILRETLAYNFTKEGFAVEQAADGPAAIALARTAKPDLIVLDLMLPGIDGFEVCRSVRRESTVPILMLTARDAEVDRVVGLEVGADDYLTKPFSMRELMARVRAMLRRVKMIEGQASAAQAAPDPNSPMTFGDLTIDPRRHEVRRGGQALPLRPKEYDLLLLFAQHRGQALGRETLLELVWGWTYEGGSRTVDVHVRWLREHIEPDPGHPTRLVTVRGAGYRFEG